MSMVVIFKYPIKIRTETSRQGISTMLRQIKTEMRLQIEMKQNCFKTVGNWSLATRQIVIMQQK